jgi:hypothetical protein
MVKVHTGTREALVHLIVSPHLQYTGLFKLLEAYSTVVVRLNGTHEYIVQLLYTEVYCYETE